MTHPICDACECVSLCSKSGCRPLVSMPEKPALPLSTSVTSLQLELSAAIEMAVRDRMLVKELAAALESALQTAKFEHHHHRAWHDEARAALSKVPQ